MQINKIGKKIKDRRMSLGITQQEFANRLKKTQSFVSRLEAGSRMPSLGCSSKIEKILKLRNNSILNIVISKELKSYESK